MIKYNDWNEFWNKTNRMVRKMRSPEIIKMATRGKGMGRNGERQYNFGTIKCKCPQCSTLMVGA